MTFHTVIKRDKIELSVMIQAGQSKYRQKKQITEGVLQYNFYEFKNIVYYIFLLINVHAVKVKTWIWSLHTTFVEKGRAPGCKRDSENFNFIITFSF